MVVGSSMLRESLLQRLHGRQRRNRRYLSPVFKKLVMMKNEIDVILAEDIDRASIFEETSVLSRLDGIHCFNVPIISCLFIIPFPHSIIYLFCLILATVINQILNVTLESNIQQANHM